MALLNIIYDGNDATTYKGVELLESFTDKKHFFNSGDLSIDWYNAKKFYLVYLQKKDPFLSTLSSCDHFFFDGGTNLYDSAYMRMDGENPVLHYGHHQDGWEFFVQKNTMPIFQELKMLAQPFWPKN